MIVVDASAMVDALVDDPANPELLTLLSEDDLHAPSLLDFEVAGALRGHSLAGKLPRRRLLEAVADFSALQVVRHQMTDLMAHILELRRNFTVYDASYVVLAQALDAQLVTADRKLTEARRRGVEVRLIGR
ncbi:MAG TPA: type II toxin-antitoxin system VapC family toxin [Jatrophihabitantaceae bacterium]|nr:type II toxin-antitoxin system VapC family toxin [Jatrophihabitantaceae bacterium]